MNVVDRIKEVMEVRGVTQTELAAACGWSFQNLNNKFRRRDLKFSDVEKICKVLHCSVSFILDDTGEKI